MLDVDPAGQRDLTATEMATNPLSASPQKHSLGGCTVDMPLSNCYRPTHVSPRDTFVVIAGRWMIKTSEADLINHIILHIRSTSQSKLYTSFFSIR